MPKELGLKYCVFLVVTMLTIGISLLLVRSIPQNDVFLHYPFRLSHAPTTIEFPEHIYIHDVMYISCENTIVYTITSTSERAYYHFRRIRRSFKLIGNEWHGIHGLLQVTHDWLYHVPPRSSVEWSFNLNAVDSFRNITLPEGVYLFMKPLYPWPLRDERGVEREASWLPLILEVTSDSP